MANRQPAIATHTHLHALAGLEGGAPHDLPRRHRPARRARGDATLEQLLPRVLVLVGVSRVRRGSAGRGGRRVDASHRCVRARPRLRAVGRGRRRRALHARARRVRRRRVPARGPRVEQRRRQRHGRHALRVPALVHQAQVGRELHVEAVRLADELREGPRDASRAAEATPPACSLLRHACREPHLVHHEVVVRGVGVGREGVRRGRQARALGVHVLLENGEERVLGALAARGPSAPAPRNEAERPRGVDRPITLGARVEEVGERARPGGWQGGAAGFCIHLRRSRGSRGGSLVIEGQQGYVRTAKGGRRVVKRTWTAAAGARGRRASSVTSSSVTSTGTEGGTISRAPSSATRDGSVRVRAASGAGLTGTVTGCSTAQPRTGTNTSKGDEGRGG